MAFVVRRLFIAKVGKSDQLVAHHKEMDKLFQQQGFNMKRRILTDYQSGRTDRVVMEWEVNDLKEYEEIMGNLMSSPENKQTFSIWVTKLTDLIHYAEVET